MPAPSIVRRFLPLALAGLGALVLSGCGDKDEAPQGSQPTSQAQAPSSTPADAAGKPVESTLVVHAPRDGRRRAELRLTPAVELHDLRIQFTVPSACRIVAGAAVRVLPKVAPGDTIQQAVMFECEGETTGQVDVKFQAGHGEGQAVTKTLNAQF